MVNKNSFVCLPLLALTGMVSSDTGLPDPDNPNGELPRVSNEDVILVTDDDDDSDEQETVLLDDYLPLPGDEDAAESNHGYGSSEDEAAGPQPTSNSPVSDSVPPIPAITPIEQVLVQEIWSGPPPKIVDIEMDSKKVDEVKEVMASITLPPSSIPEWATSIPEEEWKSQLLKRLQNLDRKN